MKKLIFILILVGLCAPLTLFASGGGEGGDKGAPLVALVTDTGGIDDKSFNQGTWNGIQRYVKDNNIPESAYTFLQSESDADYIPNLSTVADEGYKLIVAPGFLFVDAVAEVSNNYPDTHFLVIDTVVEDRPNVVSAVFAEEQGSFLVGVAAGLAAKAQGYSKVGFIGGVDFAVIQNFEAGFEYGVKEVAPDVDVLVEYAGDFSNPQKGQTIATKMYDQGVGIIFTAAGSTGNGAIKEAKDRTSQGDPVWIIGVDRDQYEEGFYDASKSKSIILTSMLKRADNAVYATLESHVAGTFEGKVIKFDIRNGGVGIPEKNPNLTKDIVDTVNSYKDKIVSGEITVSNVPSRLK